MNLLELKNTIAAYLHRKDMDAQLPAFFEMANFRISKDVRSPLNTTLLSVDITADPYFWIIGIPDLLDIRALYRQDGNGNTTQIMPTTIDNILALPATGGNPRMYAQAGLLLYVRPFVAGVYQFLYYQNVPPMINDDDSNVLSVVCPQLYVYAVLMEAFFFTQDGELAAFAERQYKAEVERLNHYEDNNPVSGSPVMRRV